MSKSILEKLQDIRDRNYDLGQDLIDKYFFSDNPETQKNVKIAANNY